MKLIFSFFLFFSTWVFVGLSEKYHIGLTARNLEDALPSQNMGGVHTDAGDGTAPPLQCVQKLLPCKPYLHSSTPPGLCCVPLIGMINDDVQCLCSVINDPALLQSLNITSNDAINLARSCGSEADVSVCKQNGTSPSTPSATPSPKSSPPATPSPTSTPPATPSPSPPSPSSALSNRTSPGNPSNDNTTTKSAAHGISGSVAFFTACIALVFEAY